MQSYTNQKTRKAPFNKTLHSNYLFHLHEAPEATLAKTDLLSEAQKEENQVSIDKIKNKLLSKSLENFEPWEIERKTCLESEGKQKMKKEVEISNWYNRKSLSLDREKGYLKSEMSVDKMKKCTFLKFEAKVEEQSLNKRYDKNSENKRATSFYSLRKFKDCNLTFNQQKHSIPKNKLNLSHRLEVKSKKKLSHQSDIIQIEHSLTNYAKIQKQMMGSTLRKKIPKQRQSNLLSLNNTSINLCQSILIKKSEPIQKEISKILKLLSEEKSFNGLL